MSTRSRRPPQQYLSAEYVLGEMCDFGEHRLEHLSVPQVLILAMVVASSPWAPSSQCCSQTE